MPAFSYSQDIIVKKNNDTLRCTIKRVDSKKIWFVPLKSNVTDLFPLKQALSYTYQGITTIVTKDLINYKDWKSHTPGQELRLASNHFYTGSLIMVGGVILAYAGAYNKAMPVSITGGVLSLVGYSLIFESHNHIRRAGILIDKK